VADAETLTRIREILGIETPLDAHDNLSGMVTDLDHLGRTLDDVGYDTLTRVLGQLHTVSAVLQSSN